MEPHEHVVSYTLGHQEQIWWICTCGDEGGPFESYEAALDADIKHEQFARRNP